MVELSAQVGVDRVGAIDRAGGVGVRVTSGDGAAAAAVLFGGAFAAATVDGLQTFAVVVEGEHVYDGAVMDDVEDGVGGAGTEGGETA